MHLELLCFIRLFYFMQIDCKLFLYLKRQMTCTLCFSQFVSLLMFSTPLSQWYMKNKMNFDPLSPSTPISDNFSYEFL